MTVNDNNAAANSEIFVFCKTCKQNVSIHIDNQRLTSATSGIISVVSMHGEPSHAILVYLDKNLSVRGIEYPYAFVSESEVTESSESEIKKISQSSNINLHALIESFGLGTKKNIRVFGNLLMQVLLSNPVYLIHDELSQTSEIIEKIDDLFTNQKLSLKCVTHAEIPNIKDRQPFIFDLQDGKYLYEGIKVDTKYFENLVKEVMDDKEGSFKLKNELSKIFYSYEKMKYIISTTDRKIKETQLSQDIGIELTLTPLLLRMATSEDIDVKERVESDGMARALRSI